ncbi:ABC transporter ATP-binding protein [Ruminiclostridium cellulolyticum]|uniref:Quaternary amine transport ATP-binding protein n=1 Tax=Ruminiclostridium cellulolyticum (strain ATCC 35319 / DSM 5812 / JCM 6584 / H10) TaxID=394503 RepID=B8I167_RUMCH|nr:ABC transporter ATP-binding protein [Ruminiclostridium cellulolyticum]ACL77623.1 glycine betaine/L-proline ABC transporter, ATPase subunit [Ruminiclostridium cellulolyticum H10]
MIKFENIFKKYKDTTVLKNISLEVEKGQLVSLIGESGCGKTTTLKMINRLIKPSSGKIFINGKDIEKRDIIKLRRNMGYVIQQTGLFPHMTIKENIELIPKVQKKDSEEIRKKTYELLEMVGLEADEFLDRYPSEISGGQQQRVGVARAFATDPEIILMDEPFSALDPITRISLQDELINIQAIYKKTIVFVTHDMDEAIKISDKICIMKDGEILQYDTPENILKNPQNEFVSEFVGRNRIWTSPEFIKAKDIMIDTPVTCQSSTTLLGCIERMRVEKVDSLMVVEEKTKRLLGIVNAKQIQNQRDRTIKVGDIMTTNFLSVLEDDSIIDILKIVDEKHVSAIPVLNESDRLLGLITKSSLVTTLSQQYLDLENLE